MSNDEGFSYNKMMPVLDFTQLYVVNILLTTSLKNADTGQEFQFMFTSNPTVGKYVILLTLTMVCLLLPDGLV